MTTQTQKKWRRKFVGVFATMFLGAVVPGCGSSPTAQSADEWQDSEAVAGELVVGQEPTPGMVAPDVSAVGTVLSVNAKLGITRVKLNAGMDRDAAVATLRKVKGVTFVEPNFISHKATAPDDTSYASQYYLPLTHADGAWSHYVADSSVTSSAPVVVAVVDTGVKADHEDLAAKVVAGYNELVTANPPDDDEGHGTHLAGVVAAQVNNTLGVAGVASFTGVAGDADPANVKVMPVKVLDAAGKGNHTNIAAGVTYAVDHGAKVIVLSFGSTTPSWTLQKAVQYAWTGGALVVAAAGNAGNSVSFYPAAYQASNQNVLSVGASDTTDTLWTGSNYGSWVNVVAPGVGINSTAFDGAYAAFTGTSSAAAVVAGEAALIWSAHPTLTNAQLRNVMMGSIDTYNRPLAKNVQTGGGRVNMDAALTASATPAQVLGSVSFAASSTKGGSTLDGVLTLINVAPAGGAIVTLTSGTPAAMTVPASVTVPAGARTMPFKASALTVSSDSTVTVTAAYAGVSVTSSVVVHRPGIASVAVSPATVAGGQGATGTVTLDSAAPAAGTTVSLSSGNAHAVVPATVLVPANGKTVTFAVTTTTVTAPTLATITATGGGSTKAFDFHVNPVLGAVTLVSSTVKGGATAVATVKLNQAAPVGGAVITLSSSDTLSATVPGSMTIAAGASSGTFTVTTLAVSANAPVTLSAAYAGATSTVAMTVAAPALSGLTLSSSTMITGQTVTGTVTLDASAPTGGTVVTLTASDSLLSVPAAVTVAAGVKTGTFSVTTAAPLDTVAVVLTGTLGSVSKTANLSVKPALASLTLSSSSVLGGASVVGTILLNGNAAASTAVAVASDSARATVSSTATVASGAKTQTFTVTTVAGVTSATANISVTLDGVTKTVALKVNAPLVSALAFNASTVAGGSTLTGTVTLSAAAPTGGATVSLASSSPAATVPTTVSVLEGATTGTFTLTGVSVAKATAATITATFAGSSKTASVTVQPPALSAVSASASTVAASGTLTGTVTLTGVAPTGGLVVTLSASNAAVTVPASVTVAAGSSTGTFTITAAAVSSDTSVVVVATSNSVSKTVSLTVVAP